MARIAVPRLISNPVVYLDTTGDNKKWSHDLTICGFFSVYLFWEKFSRAWRNILARPPALPFWHQTDVRNALSANPNPKNPFLGFDRNALKRKELSLTKLLADNMGPHTLMPYAASVSHEAVARVLTGKLANAGAISPSGRAHLRLDLMERAHFILALYTAKSFVSGYVCEYPLPPIDCFIETRGPDEYELHFHRVWNRIKSRVPGLGTITFAAKADPATVPIQAADLLGWHLNYRSMHPSEGDDPLWSKLFAGADFKPAKVTEADLDMIVGFWSDARIP